MNTVILEIIVVKKFDELVAKGAATGDQEKRAEYYKEAQAVLAEDYHIYQ